jgi:transposase
MGSSSKAVRAIVRGKGAHLGYLPPYSPDLNPIEQVFAKLKHLVRKAQPRDVDATWRRGGQLLDLFTPAELANYLVNCGYGSV